MENHIIELMQAEIDGENSPENSKMILSILKKNEDARSLYDDLLDFSIQMEELKARLMFPGRISAQLGQETSNKIETREIKTTSIHNIKGEEKIPDLNLFSGRTAAIIAVAALVIVIIIVTTQFMHLQ